MKQGKGIPPAQIFTPTQVPAHSFKTNYICANSLILHWLTWHHCLLNLLMLSISPSFSSTSKKCNKWTHLQSEWLTEIDHESKGCTCVHNTNPMAMPNINTVVHCYLSGYSLDKEGIKTIKCDYWCALSQARLIKLVPGPHPHTILYISHALAGTLLLMGVFKC